VSRCGVCARWRTGGLGEPAPGEGGIRAGAGGIVAALPHIDDFVAGHSLAAFEELTEVVADA
jgi:uncharacterized protein with von Willebrand factor type A (vWA) domain